MAALIAGRSGAASAQTTDAGYWDALTPSTARAEAKKK
jgi:hypothetical protein